MIVRGVCSKEPNELYQCNGLLGCCHELEMKSFTVAISRSGFPKAQYHADGNDRRRSQ